MPSITQNSRFNKVIQSLSPRVQKKIFPIADKICENAQEIRLRINRPLAIVCPKVTYYITESGGLTSTPIKNSMLIISRADIVETFNNLCNYSVYTRQNEIANGYITMPGGHRAGICGTAVSDGEKINNVRDISSINIRIAREFKGCAEKLLNRIGDISGGLLICGAPCSGKTTVLRDLARLLSNEKDKNVSLIDERGELAATCFGMYQNDIGMCDVFDLYKKSSAMLQAVRSMAPDIIICDEIGSQEDVTAIEHCLNCGVTVIATVHAMNEIELRRKENIKKLIACGAFENIVFLSNKNSPCEIVKVIRSGDFIVH